MRKIRPKRRQDVAGSRLAKGVEQAMQSSAMVALRTMIMIVCLVAVPLAAVFGTALSKAVKSAFGYREAWQPSKLAEDEQPPRVDSLALAADNDPRILQPTPEATSQPQTEQRESPILPHAKITGVRALPEVPTTAAADKADEPMIETAPLWNPAPRTARTPRDRQMTTHFVPAPAPQRDILRQGRVDSVQSNTNAAVARRRSARRTESLQQTVYSPPDEVESPSDTDGLVPVERVANDGALADSERRLRELGATYYRLEIWGDEGNFYRCSCSVPISPRGRAMRHFEAIESAPSQAINVVIKQVETWRSRQAAR
jgi:hypothetical protein